MGTHKGPDPGNSGFSIYYITARTKKITRFVSSQGNSEFASIQQDGTVESDPVFPFNVRFHPTGEFTMPADNYDEDMATQMLKIPVGTVLYEVWARDVPEELGGTEVKIAEIITFY